MTTVNDRLIQPFARTFYESRARGKSLSQLENELTHSQQFVEERIRRCAQSDGNHRVVTHIVGIERWCDARIRVVFGAPLIMDEYDGYRPARDAGWDDLIALFAETRGETLSLLAECTAQTLDARVAHNLFGDLRVATWFKYIQIHGDVETYKLRGRNAGAYTASA